MIDRRHFFCRVVSLAAGPKPFVLVPFGECHTAAPYHSSVYLTSLIRGKPLHVEAAILVNVNVCELIFAWTFLMCGPHSSFVSLLQPTFLSIPI